MHEMSLAQGILDVALSNAAQHAATNISRIKLLIGEMTNVETESLKFCFSALSANTIAAKAEIEIEIKPLMGRCRDCKKEFKVSGYYFVCPNCGSSAVEVVSGRELSIEHMEVD